MLSKKLLSLVLVIMILIGTLNTALAAPDKDILRYSRDKAERITGERSLSYDVDARGLTDRDEVRVIVELEEEPIIEYATARGVKVNELDKETRKQLKKRLLEEQKRIKQYLKSNGIKMKELGEFVNVVNGFSIETSFGDAKFIERAHGVSNVYLVNEYDRPSPDLVSSKDIVKARETWANLGYDGEGMVVAIIDTGVDPSHRDMILTNPENARLQREDIEELIDSRELPGQWHTAKVPYGYNYMDENQEILDLGPDASEHGMHVAGIVGANGDEDNNGVKGIAPEVQLLAMKVFGNNPAMPSTFGDVIVKAIDDSVALGVDVINMSLGSTASFVMPDDLEQVAVKRAMENGVVCAISAGNSAQFGNEWDDPYTENPDIGVVGSPGLAVESIQVASVENTDMTTTALEYEYNGELLKAGYIAAGGLDPVSEFRGEIEYVNCGLGKPEECVDAIGKIALIQRGEITFVEKIQNAQDKGAIGVIVYNNAAGGEALVNMAYPEDGNIPAVFIQLSHGMRLVELIELGENFVEFNGDTTLVPNPNSGKMSDFTSWGSTPNLDFKPEITGPGGNIWSTAQNDSYQLMSGTSMAAPHVAGGLALVLQRVDENFGLTESRRVEMAKNLIMSTAHPLGDKGLYNDYYGLTDYNFTSPRRQGAGVMDLYAATTTPAIVVDRDTGLSKVNLQEIDDYTTFTITVENFGEEEISYRIKGTVQTDLTDGEYNYLETQGVYIEDTIERNGPNGYWSGEFPISFSDEEIIVPVGESVDIDVEIDLSDAVDWFNNAPLYDIFPNGTFIEGFVTLEDINDSNPTLSIPYMGFYGDWDEAPIIDANNYDEYGVPFYGVTAMAWLDELEGEYYFLGYDFDGNPNKDNISFSPNGDGVADTTIPILSFLRNAREVALNILDEDGHLVRELYMGEYFRKNYHDGRYPIYTAHDLWTWDGTIDNEIAADGQYYYEINTRIDYPGAQWQTVTFPVKIDTTNPIIEDILFDDETKELTIIANDRGNEIYLYYLVEKGEVIDSSLDGIFDLSEAKYSNKTVLIIEDFAGNKTIEGLESVLKKSNEKKPKKDKDKDNPENPEIPENPGGLQEPIGPAEGDTDIPTVMVTEPEFFGVYNDGSISISGYINDKSSIESFRINDVDVPFVWNEITGNWDFNTDISLEDGYHSINIEAMDSAGNNIAFAHKIFVDTEAPVIEMIGEIPKSTKEDVLVLSAIIKDNLPSLIVRINGDMVTNIAPDWAYFNELDPALYELMDYEIELVDGKNIIIIEAVDDAGNISRVEFQLNKIKSK